MLIVIEDFVPYDRSFLWRLHDAYYAARGGAAWATQEIPSTATSSYPMARQQARLLVSLVAELEESGTLRPRDPVSLLEIGSGSGKFAGMFLRALERGCGKAGRALLPRIRYVLSDYSEVSLRDAMRNPDVAAHAESGRILPAILDVRNPTGLRQLDGRPVEGPLVATFANYLVCATPLKTLRRTPEGTFERRVRVGVKAELEPTETEREAAERCAREVLANPTEPGLAHRLEIEFDWSPIDLATAFADPIHRAALEARFEGQAEATTHYPYSFFDCVNQLRPLLAPGAMVVINDYGSSEAEETEGERWTEVEHYGNTLSVGLDFAIFDAFARAAGLASVRTHNPLNAVHTVALRFAPDVSPSFLKAFDRIHVKGDEGQSLLELTHAANASAERAEWDAAARLFERCARLDPTNAEYLYKLGRSCVEAGHPLYAIPILRRGRKRDRTGRWDCDFQLGRAYSKLRRPHEALRAFERSAEHRESASTFANMAQIHEALGDRDTAYQLYRRALATSDDSTVSALIVRHLCKEYLPESSPDDVASSRIPDERPRHR